ncbi:MAG: M28 family peptidase [Candidatus Eisenbacteria bacterium]|nr:M28 family peptidase [Candidatus Eisenbacteria bacterium]
MRFCALVGLLVLGAAGLPTPPAPANAGGPAPIAAGAAENPARVVSEACSRLTLARLAGHVQYLGRDILRGRAPGTAGGDTAAAYIARRMGEFGLTPLGPDSSFFQYVPLHGSTSSEESLLRLTRNDSTVKLSLWNDYLLHSAGAQTWVARPTPLVFVGYGIVAPEFDYSDYQSVDVDGAIAVFLSGEPPSEDPSYFHGPWETMHASPAAKRRLALSRGARGTILIPSPRRYVSWERRKRDYGFEYLTLAYGESDNLSLVLNPKAAESLFRGSGHRFADVCRWDSAGAVRSFPLETSISFHGSFAERDFLSPNVAGLLPGGDPLQADSYVLIVAHYDHLGVGIPVEGDSIYNGVVDNATGVAALLEIARVYAAGERAPARSMLFLCVTAEEEGQLGARYYCDHPLVPLYKSVAALNIDGLAFLDTFDDVIAVGGEYSTLSGHAAAAARSRGLRLAEMPAGLSPREEFTRSDQYIFARAGVPAVLLQEGLHYRNYEVEDAVRLLLVWGRDVYHSPFDDLHQPLNPAAALQHTQVLATMAGILAETHAEPQWLPGAPFAAVRMRSFLERR